MGRSIPVVGVRASGARAPPVPSALVGALGSAEEDLRRHGTCAPAAMARVSGVRDGDGRRTDGEGANDTGVSDTRMARPVMSVGRWGMTRQPMSAG